MRREPEKRRERKKMQTKKFFDETTGAPYFCVVDGRGHKMRVVGSISEGDGWIAAIRDLMDRSDLTGLGEKLMREAPLIECREEPAFDEEDAEDAAIYHAYTFTLHRYQTNEALETRRRIMEQVQEPEM